VGGEQECSAQSNFRESSRCNGRISTTQAIGCELAFAFRMEEAE
jgi:hypothetical protein